MLRIWYFNMQSPIRPIYIDWY